MEKRKYDRIIVKNGKIANVWELLDIFEFFYERLSEKNM